MAWQEGDVIRLWRLRVATAIDGCVWQWQWTTAVAVAAVSNDASAITVTTPVQRGGWHGRNDGKDASNRGNATGNNYLTTCQSRSKTINCICNSNI